MVEDQELVAFYRAEHPQLLRALSLLGEDLGVGPAGLRSPRCDSAVAGSPSHGRARPRIASILGLALAVGAGVVLLDPDGVRVLATTPGEDMTAADLRDLAIRLARVEMPARP